MDQQSHWIGQIVNARERWYCKTTLPCLTTSNVLHQVIASFGYDTFRQRLTESLAGGDVLNMFVKLTAVENDRPTYLCCHAYSIYQVLLAKGVVGYHVCIYTRYPPGDIAIAVGTVGLIITVVLSYPLLVHPTRSSLLYIWCVHCNHPKFKSPACQNPL